MFSRKELFDYFAQFTQEQVLSALAEIAKSDSSIKPDAENFPSSLVEQLKATLKPAPIKKNSQQLAPVTSPTLSAEIQDGEEVISRQNLLAYFNKYQPEQIDQALTKLGQDPKQPTIPVAIANRLEYAFSLIESALAKQKESGMTGGQAELQSLALDIAAGQINIPHQIFSELIEVVTGKAIVQGTVLGRLSNIITEQVYQDTTADYLANKIDSTGADIAALYEILQDPQKRDSILRQYGLKTEIEQQAQFIMQKTCSNEEEFNADEYLRQVSAKKFAIGTNSQKQNIWSPRTSKDIQKMTTAILKQCMK